MPPAGPLGRSVEQAQELRPILPELRNGAGEAPLALVGEPQMADARVALGMLAPHESQVLGPSNGWVTVLGARRSLSASPRTVTGSPRRSATLIASSSW